MKTEKNIELDAIYPTADNVKKIDGIEDLFLLESIAVHFNFRIFLKQVFIHLAYPFGYFFSPNPSAQLFTNFSPVVAFYSHFTPIMLIICIIAYCMMRYDIDPKQFHHFAGCLWYPILYFALHRLSVAVKYASLSQSEYARFMDPHNSPALSMQYMNQYGLISAWGKRRNHRVSDFLIVSSALRVGAHIDALRFIIDNPTQSVAAASQMKLWKSFFEAKLGGENENISSEEFIIELPNGSYSISVFDACQRIMQISDVEADYLDIFSIVAKAITFCLVSIPFFGFLDLYGITASWISVYLVFSSIVVGLYFYTIFQFLFVAVLDVMRLERSQQLLHSLIRLTDIRSTFQFSMNSPSGNISHAESCAVAREGAEAKRVLKAALTHSLLYESDTVKPLSPSAIPGDVDLHDRLISSQKQMTDADSDDDNYEEDTMSVTGEELLHPGTDHTYQPGCTHLFPRLSLRYTENLNSWCWARLVVLNVGVRFTARLEIFAFMCLLSNIVLMAAALGMIFAASQGAARVEAFHTPLFRQAVASIAVITLFLIFYTYSAANINWELEQQRATIATHLLRVRERIIELTEVQTKRRQQKLAFIDVEAPTLPSSFDKAKKGNIIYDEVDDDVESMAILYWVNLERSIVSTLEAVQATNQYQMHYVMGVPATYSICATIVSTAISFIATLITTYSTAQTASQPPTIA